jgi:hypothetical protein
MPDWILWLQCNESDLNSGHSVFEYRQEYQQLTALYKAELVVYTGHVAFTIAKLHGRVCSTVENFLGKRLLGTQRKRWKRTLRLMLSKYGSGVAQWVWLQTGRPGFNPRHRKRIFPLASVSRLALRPTQPLSNGHRGVLSPGVKCGRGVTLTTHSHLVPRWKSRSYNTSPPCRLYGDSGRALLYEKKISCEDGRWVEVSEDRT